MADRVAVVRDIFGDDGPGSGSRSITDANRSDQHRVGADEGVLADDRSLLRLAVEVAGDRARADVGSRTHLGVADITEVSDLDVLADAGFLEFRVRADMDARLDLAAGADGRIRADLDVVVERRTSDRA